jgi:hypothetical protein
LLGLLSSWALSGCQGCGDGSPGDAVADAGPAGLSPQAAAQVLARVGERTIRLGDYATALERMDELERLRYQTKERRRALLDEMIDLELLAREAERRGLDRRPETRALVRQLERDLVLARLYRSLPGVESIPASEVAEHYRAHPDDFWQPELRRVAILELSDAAEAGRALSEALGSDAVGWRRLVARHAAGAAAPEEPAPEPESATARPAESVPGDLGMLARQAADDEVADVPDELRAAAFAIAEDGAVFPELVRVAGRYHVVRLVGRVAARRRTLSEVEASIRVLLVAERQRAAEAELLERLRQKFPVVIDEAALSQIAAPGAPAP